MEDYQVDVISSLDQWEKASKSWNELLSQSASNTIFLTWEWLYSWAECFLNKERTLFVLVVSQNNELIGIAPWYIGRTSHGGFPIRQIEFLGTPESGSDYLDVFAKRGKEKEVAFCIYDFLQKEVRPLWDCLILKDIPANSLFLLYFLNKIEEKGKYAEIRYGSFCPTVLFPKGNEDFFSQVSPHRRKRFNRELRILQGSENIKQYSYFVKEDIIKILGEFFGFYSEAKNTHDHNLSTFMERVLSRYEEKIPIQIDVLKSDGKIIAGLLHLFHGDTQSLYLMATDKTFNPKISIGNVVVGLSIQKAIKQGFSKFDFLKGPEEYKFYWANEGRSCCNVFFYQRKAVPILLAGETFLKYLAKIVLR